MALTVNAMKIAEQYLTEALKQLHAEHALRTMHVDIAITDTDNSRTVGRVNLRCRGEQGALTISTQLNECTQGELLLLAGSALVLYGQATDALATTDTTERDERDVWNMLQYKLLTAADPDGMYMTPEEVAVYTGMSVQALAMARHRGAGPKCLRPTLRVVRYRKRDVDAWMDAGSGE